MVMGATGSWLSSLGHMAAALNLETLNFESTLSFLILVVAWSLVRPAMLRDYDNRRLPYNTTARVAFSSAWALIFIALTITLHFFVSATETIAGAIPPPFQGLLTSFKGQPPLLAAITLGGLLQFAFFRDIERSAVVWLHSRRHIHDDLQALTHHLERCAFSPSPEEQSKNRDSLKKYGIYLTDETIGGIGLVTVDRWRKLASLIRLVREWNTEEDHVLGQEDMQHLAEVATAHERKTELAMTIVKLLDAQGGEASKALSAMLKLLAETPHVDRASVEAAEARAKIIVSRASDDVVQRPLRISGEELKRHLAQIESYFEIEYQILLQRAAELAAKSVVLASDRAPGRLEQLKMAGFAGLGRIDRISLDRILWLFLVVACGGFLVMFMGYRKTMTPQMAEGLARFAFVMSIAALIGAAIGSHRRHSRSAETPWGAYFGAGIGAGAIFVGVTLVANLVKTTLAGDAAAQQPAWSLARILPWALLPCLVTVAIARLARVEAWPELHRLRSFQNVGERTMDGICVAFAVFVAYGTAVAVHAPLGIRLPPSLEESLKAATFPIPIPWALLGLGFLIGFFVVRDVRRAAHGTIIARPGRSPPAAAPAEIGSPTTVPAQLPSGAA
jgi:hypothetical protein